MNRRRSISATISRATTLVLQAAVHLEAWIGCTAPVLFFLSL